MRQPSSIHEGKGSFPAHLPRPGQRVREGVQAPAYAEVEPASETGCRDMLSNGQICGKGTELRCDTHREIRNKRASDASRNKRNL